MIGIALICLLTATLIVGVGIKIDMLRRLHEIDGMQGVYLQDKNKLIYGQKP